MNKNAELSRSTEISSRVLSSIFGYSRETGRRRINVIKKELGISGASDRMILWGEYCDFYRINADNK